MNKGTGRIIFMILAIALNAGACERTLDKERQDAVAAVYADILLVESLSGPDSAAATRSVDSVLKLHGFADRNELNDDLKIATEHPEIIRSILDSAQRRLQGVQQGSQIRVKPQ